MGRVKTIWEPYVFGLRPSVPLKGWKWGYLVFHRKRLGPRVLPWQPLRRSHSLPFVIHISGAKFEEHCSNISRDIDDWVLYCFSGTIYDVITFFICIIQKRKYLKSEKRYSKKENAILLYFKKPFKVSGNYFLLHRHFKLPITATTGRSSGLIASVARK